MKQLTFAIVLFAIWIAHAERQPLTRYRTIIDRQMFGEPPPGFDPTKMPSEVQKTSAKAEAELTKEQEQVKKAIKFSVIDVTPGGETRVGFTDNGNPKMPLNYFLKVGESRNGWKVLAADAETATMTIAKDDIEVTLTLGGDSSSNASAVSRVGPDGRAPGATSALRGSSLFGAAATARERRARREAERQAQAAEAAKKAEELAAAQAKKEEDRARREAEEKAQRDAERADMQKQLQELKDQARKAREEREAARAAEEAKANAEETPKDAAE